jgi:hypothetical protein
MGGRREETLGAGLDTPGLWIPLRLIPATHSLTYISLVLIPPTQGAKLGFQTHLDADFYVCGCCVHCQREAVRRVVGFAAQKLHPQGCGGGVGQGGIRRRHKR